MRSSAGCLHSTTSTASSSRCAPTAAQRATRTRDGQEQPELTPNALLTRQVVGGEAPLHLPEVSPAIAPSSTPPPVDIHARACFKVVHSERVFVRAAPSLSGKIAGSAGPDDVVHVDRMRRGFVEAEGGTLLLQEWVKLTGPPNAEAEVSANAEVDAVAERWMLVEHATLGVLLRECQPDGSDATRSAFGRKEL